MGFGLLFIGYLATFLMSMAGDYGCYPAIVGCLVMLYALTKLVEYEDSFKYAFFAAIPMTICVAFDLAGAVAGVLGSTLPGFLGSVTLDTVMKYAKLVFELAFHIFLLLSVAKIAGDTGVDRTRRAAIRNLVIYAVYFVAATVTSMLPSGIEAAAYLFIAQFVMYLVWMVLNSIALFSCYMRICDEDDQDMKAKPSRFEAVNRWRAEFDRREEHARQAQRDYRAEKMKKRAEELKNRKNKKK